MNNQDNVAIETVQRFQYKNCHPIPKYFDNQSNQICISKGAWYQPLYKTHYTSLFQKLILYAATFLIVMTTDA